MKRRDIVVGVLLLGVLAGVVYWRQYRTQSQSGATPTPQTLSIQDQIEQKFNTTIPENVDKAELKDISGGNGSGLATRQFENGQYSNTILADLPDPQSGSFYEGWLAKGEEGSDNYQIIATGGLQVAKGGWMLNFQSSTDYSEYNSVIVSSEEKVGDAPSQKVLEGSF